MPLFYTEGGFLSAVRNGDTDTVAKYLKKDSGHYLKASDKNGMMGLHLAAQYGRFDALKMLIDAGAPLDEKTGWNHTPLDLAVGHGYVKAVAALLDAGAHNGNQSAGQNPLVRSAVEHGNLEVLELLLKAKAHPDGSRALTRALQYRNDAAAEMLLKAGASPEVHDGHYTYPVHIAALNGALETLRLLKEKGADINVRDSSGYSALHMAVLNEQNNAAELLLTLGCDPELLDNKGRTALDYAHIKKNKGLVKSLEAVTQKPSQVAVARAEKAAKKAAPAAAAPANDGTEEKWVRMGAQRVAHIGTYPELNRKLTEVFNFSARERIIITENLKTGAESMGAPESFDSLEEAPVRDALAQFRKLGGAADDSVIASRGRKLRMP